MRHVRNGGQALAKCINDGISGAKTFWRQGKRGYLKGLIGKIGKYNLLNCCVPREYCRKSPPWDDEFVDVTILPLAKKKCMYSAVDLKKIIVNAINVDYEKTAQVYCDGSVMEDGKAGCGILVIDSGKEIHIESEYSYRIPDNVSSTQAELCAILFGLWKIKDGMGDVCFFVDSRSALESLNSKNPVYVEMVNQCKAVIEELKQRGRKITFMWIPSHIGIRNNDRADELAKMGIEKEIIDMDCTITLKQIKTIIRKTREEEEAVRMEKRHLNSETMRHYIDVLENTNFTYGKYKSAWKDSLCTRLRLGYKYYWQLGIAKEDDETCCRLCREPRAHTLSHYVLECPNITSFRNCSINNVGKQIIWMFNNNKIDEMMRKCKKVRDILR